MKFSIKNFFSKCDQIPSFPWIWLHLLKKSLMENFIFLRSGQSSHHVQTISQPAFTCSKSTKIFLRQHLLVQIQQWKHQSSVWSMFKVNNKDNRPTSLTPGGQIARTETRVFHSNHIYWRNPEWKTSVFVQCVLVLTFC